MKTDQSSQIKGNAWTSYSFSCPYPMNHAVQSYSEVQDGVDSLPTLIVIVIPSKDMEDTKSTFRDISVGLVETINF